MSLLDMAYVPAVEVSPRASVKDAVSCSLPEGCGAVAVVERGRMVGILTSRDVILKVVLPQLDPAATLVKEVMSTPVLTLHPETAPEKALEFMLTHHVRHVPLSEDGKKVRGMLALSRVLQFIVKDQAHDLFQMEAFLTVDGPGG